MRSGCSFKRRVKSASKYVRKRLFDGGLRDRDKLREIAVLHVFGRRIQDLAEKTEIEAGIVADTLGDICAAIGGLTVDLDDARVRTH